MSKIAMITGGTGGIGMETAKALGKQGYEIILNGIDSAQGEKALQTLADMGIKAELFLYDVTKEEEVLAGWEKIGAKYEKIDVLVNNAGGLGGRSRFEEMTTEFYRFVMALNLDSAFFNSRAAIPFLKKSENASIINFTSIAGWNSGGPGAGVYGTSKAAVTTLTRALAKDLAEYGIRVNAVSPGTIDTAFHDAIRKSKPEVFESWKNNILLKRLGQPQEVASVIEFLVSEKASFITGEIVQINGGQDFL
ncbi:SDR family NAD(P)-dependent oxidoreductase [Spirochaeta isovalerica]|uniref:NAD(P)-dependent dehydrogenase (Short-subunit alcohol dehydrogenase family) n=1 Tax=Spirochaeta isovalerica TaxID=150 RepID=A0A841RAD7_9SPIO|nr:SDR family oxidoreductase [Spirochaeta isovalerica]MBB6479889.1 NAD(P)-dependent dehydrogenase (short-subunit alcohol dehydrogenase family) [Spirochaeta isovalerica]